jgi:hypothetical protein
VTEGTLCDDGDLCNGTSTWDDDGDCRGGLPPTTDDGNPCTADACDPEVGPVHAPVDEGTSCADEDVCDGEEACSEAGVCEAADPPEPLPLECNDPGASEQCDDGIRDPVSEECDDGPGTAEDSCTEDCEIRNLFVRPVQDPGGLRVRSRTLGQGPHPVAAGATATLVTFVEGESSAFGLKGALFDAQGRRTDLLDLGDEAAPSETADAGAAALPGGAFALVWNDLANGSLDIGLRRISTTQSPMVGEFQYANSRFAGAQQDPDVLWTGKELVVAWVDTFRVRHRRFNADLVPLANEAPLSPSDEVAGAVSLARFGAGWAAAWRVFDSDSGKETIRVRSGDDQWLIGPFTPGPSLERPALVELDASHLLVAFAEGTDPLESGTPSVMRLRGAILSTAGPGGVEAEPFDPQVEPYASETALSVRSPRLARVGARIYLAFESEGILGDAMGSEVWVQELEWSGDPPELNRTLEEPMQLDASRVGDQLLPALASSSLAPLGALVTVWEEHGVATVHETFPDIAFGLRPVPFVHLGGGE